MLAKLSLLGFTAFAVWRGARGIAFAESAVEASPETLAAAKYDVTPEDAQLLDVIERGCFDYLWYEVGHPAMLAKDKTSDTICSTAAVGFQLSSLPIGVERGWITKEQGAERAMKVLRALVDRQDNKKFGIYLHFIDSSTGGLSDFSNTKYQYELTASTVDHALLQAGAMTAASYFGGDVAKTAERIVADADWQAMFDQKAGYLTMGWKCKTEQGVDGPGELHRNHWEWCSDEERLIYFLAVGSPDDKHALAPATYYHTKRVVKHHADLPPFVVSWNGSLFTYFFSHCWIDYRHLAADDPTAFGESGPAVDWFENSRRAVLTQRQRCIDAAQKFPTLGENRWGLAPCAFRNEYLVHEVRPNISDNENWLHGVVPPYGAGSAIMFTPRESLAALREYKSLKDKKERPLAWRDPAKGGYAFVDSFSLDPPYGENENLGIDAGPMLLAIENVRTGLIWKLFMQHDAAQRAVERLKLSPR
ncbi:MAG TPA: glucoamylase family protein [Lacipirellulaceae bacterium]|nr:glucoamylase family protein [Lacipirellulaceae bacterium]